MLLLQVYPGLVEEHTFLVGNTIEQFVLAPFVLIINYVWSKKLR
jgi:hypothetical protein